MFNVGDMICYPMHGVGKIEAIEKRTLSTLPVNYYVLYFYAEGIRIMVPVDRADSSGLRRVIDNDKIPEVFEMLALCKDEGDSNWNKRYKENLEKMREGTACSVATVVKALSIRQEKKALSAGEKKMLSNARKILLGELVTAGAGDEDHVNQRIDQCMGCD